MMYVGSVNWSLSAAQDLNLTFIGSSAVPAAALGRLRQYRELTQLALEGCPRSGFLHPEVHSDDPAVFPEALFLHCASGLCGPPQAP